MVLARLVHQPGHIRVPDAIKAMVLAAVTSSSITKAHLQLLVLIRTWAGAIPTTGVGQIDTFDAALALPDEIHERERLGFVLALYPGKIQKDGWRQ